MIEYVILRDGSMAVDGHEHSRADLREALKPLVYKRFGDWEGEEILDRVQYQRVWWNREYNGFTHDCSQHGPNEAIEWCAGSVPVTLVVGLPERAV